MRLRTHKYNAKKIKLDGFTFDSMMEAKRYGELKLMEQAGRIRDLEVHPKRSILVRDVLVCKVILDFRYLCKLGWVYEDVKGLDNALSRLKRKMVEAQCGIKVTLIKKGGR